MSTMQGSNVKVATVSVVVGRETGEVMVIDSRSEIHFTHSHDVVARVRFRGECIGSECLQSPVIQGVSVSAHRKLLSRVKRYKSLLTEIHDLLRGKKLGDYKSKAEEYCGTVSRLAKEALTPNDRRRT